MRAGRTGEVNVDRNDVSVIHTEISNGSKDACNYVEMRTGRTAAYLIGLENILVLHALSWEFIPQLSVYVPFFLMIRDCF